MNFLTCFSVYLRLGLDPLGLILLFNLHLHFLKILSDLIDLLHDLLPLFRVTHHVVWVVRDARTYIVIDLYVF